MKYNAMMIEKIIYLPWYAYTRMVYGIAPYNCQQVKMR